MELAELGEIISGVEKERPTIKALESLLNSNPSNHSNLEASFGDLLF